MFFKNNDIIKLELFLDAIKEYLINDTNNLVEMENINNKSLKNLGKKIIEISKIIEDKRLEDLKVFGEIMLLCEKISDGFTNDIIITKSSDAKISYLCETINNMDKKLNKSICEATKILEEYENQNYLNSIDDDLFRGGKLKELLMGINSLKEKITINLQNNLDRAIILQKESSFLKNEAEILAESSMKQAISIEQASASIDELTSNVSENRKLTQYMSEIGNNVKNSAIKGNEFSTLTLEAMNEIKEATNQAYKSISAISDIAFQTNILSLNAAVEAATAGEAGRGFAVVAQEVRNLANRSAQTAKDIQKLMDILVIKTEEGTKTSSQMNDEYKILKEDIENTLTLINKVNSATKEQEDGIIQINNVISQIDILTQKNADIASKVKEIATSSNNISIEAVKSTDNTKFKEKEKKLANRHN